MDWWTLLLPIYLLYTVNLKNHETSSQADRSKITLNPILGMNILLKSFCLIPYTKSIILLYCTLSIYKYFEEQEPIKTSVTFKKLLLNYLIESFFQEFNILVER